MTPQDPKLDPLLEQAIAEIRDEPIDPAIIEAAASRVQAHLMQHATLHTCADFQALIPDYRAGNLSPARALLLKDHTHECVACYRALKDKTPAPNPQPLAPKTSRAWSTIPAIRYAIAATLITAAGLAFWAFRPAYAGPEATIESANGLIYRVSDTGTVPLIRGAQVLAGTDIRTARDAHAILRLRDGSHVEMRERSGLSVSERGRDLTIGLDHGNIIVQAAKRRAGHLYVATRDCRVAVTGTVFSVNSGLKGSRVTVVEGTVLVAQNSHQDVLHAGGQVSTSSAMGATPVTQEISWSQNSAAYIAMLNAVTALNAKLDQDQFPALRYSSNLMALAPAQTVVYASIPNLSQALTEVQQVFVPKIQQNPTLAQWWQQNNLDQVVADMAAMSSYLGNEMVIAASLTPSGHPGQPVVMAELTQPGFAAFAQSVISKLSSGANAPQLRIVTNPAAIGTISQGQCVLLILPNLVALSPDAAALQQIAAGTATTFATSEFGSQIASAYSSGVGLLFAADVQVMAASNNGHGAHMPNIQYFMVQQTANAGAPETRASLIFNGAAHRSSLLAGRARLARRARFHLPASHPGLGRRRQAAHRHHRRDHDHAAVQPGLCPAPVRSPDPARCGSAQRPGRRPWRRSRHGAGRAATPSAILENRGRSLQPDVAAIHHSEVGGCRRRASHRRKARRPCNSSSPPPMGALTTRSPAQATRCCRSGTRYTDGYLLAASNQSLLDSAIQNRASGYTLPRSAAFTALIPHDQYANFSAAIYYNTASLSPILEQFSSQPAAQQLAANLKPNLIAAYGENDRITFATSGSLFTTIGNMSLLQLLEKPGVH